MAKAKMDLSTFVGKLLEEQDGDVLWERIWVLSQAPMESEVSDHLRKRERGARPPPWRRPPGAGQAAASPL